MSRRLRRCAPTAEPVHTGAVDRNGADPLANAVWWSLTTAQAAVAEGTGAARRYQPDVSVFAALEHAGGDAWADLAELVGPGGTALLFGGTELTPPAGWVVDHRGRGHQMTGESIADIPPPASVRRLTADDLGEMMALTALTEPGPFEARTVELGHYHGIFDGERLVAMAGERMHPPGHTEISAVCTHPDARRRGHGAALVGVVARGIAERDELPFLHVAESNHAARRLYESLGFRHRRTVHVLVARAPNS